MDRVQYRASHDADGRLAYAAPEIEGRGDHGLDLRHFCEPQHRIVVEVELGDASFLDRAFAIHGGGQAVGYGALDLGGNLVRIDRVTAIDTHHHAVNLDFARLAHRHLGHRRRVTRVTHELRNATMHSGGQRLAPLRFRRHRVQYAEMLRMILQEDAAELEGVLARSPRHLVHEAFQEQAVLIRVDAAPRPDRHVGVAHRVLDQQVGHRVAELRVTRLLPQALKLAHVPAVLDIRRRQVGVDGLPGDTDVQANEIPAFIEPGREPALGDRAIEVMRLIFLAAPYELHRSSRELLGDSDRLAHEILRAAAPAEAAALVVVVGL